MGSNIANKGSLRFSNCPQGDGQLATAKLVRMAHSAINRSLRFHATGMYRTVACGALPSHLTCLSPCVCSSVVFAFCVMSFSYSSVIANDSTFLFRLRSYGNVDLRRMRNEVISD